MTAHSYTLITTPAVRDDIIQSAIALLKAVGVDVEVERYPQTVSDWYRCPFLRAPSGETFFGLDGIKSFADCEVAQAFAIASVWQSPR